MMTETEYLIATNRVKVSAALVILRDVLPGDSLGISDNEHAKIVKKLRVLEERLFSLCSLGEDGE